MEALGFEFQSSFKGSSINYDTVLDSRGLAKTNSVTNGGGEDRKFSKNRVTSFMDDPSLCMRILMTCHHHKYGILYLTPFSIACLLGSCQIGGLLEKVVNRSSKKVIKLCLVKINLKINLAFQRIIILKPFLSFAEVLR